MSLWHANLSLFENVQVMSYIECVLVVVVPCKFLSAYVLTVLYSSFISDQKAA